MTFTFSLLEPAANSDPSQSQPIMLQNFQSTNGILAVDHVTFNAVNGGTHNQVTFSTKNVPLAQTDPASTLYTDSGVASTKADLRFVNQNGTFFVSLIRAYALCSSSGITASQSFNISSVVRNSQGNYTVTITSNCTNSVNYAVFVSMSPYNPPIQVGIYTVSITGASTFTLAFRADSLSNIAYDPTYFAFLVIQL